MGFGRDRLSPMRGRPFGDAVRNEQLALLNVTLVACSMACMILARRAIRLRRVTRHRALMLAAVAAQGVFLITFVARYVLFANTEFRGHGLERVVFYAVLLSHEPLAVVSVPLVLCTLMLALLRRFTEHAQLARLAYPIWLYVSATGALLYLFLYV
jgi:putative membrane protein